MRRLLLASIAIAILQLGIPDSASAADLGPGGETTRAVPQQLELLSKGLLTRAASRTDDVHLTHATSFAPTPRSGLRLQLAHRELPAHEPAQTGPASLPAFLPSPRAPPA